MATDSGRSPLRGSGCQPSASAPGGSSQSGIPNAVGLSRARLAELLYEHEGFVDAASGELAPDREVPVWIERSLTEPHCGDCTKQAHSCMTCHAKWALEQWDEFAAMIERAAIAIETRQSGDVQQAPSRSDESAGLEEASPNSSHRPEDVGLVEKVARLVAPCWFGEGPNGHVLDNYPGQHLKCQERARETAREIIAEVTAILTPYTVDEAREVMAREMTRD